MRADQLEVGMIVELVTATDDKFGTVSKVSHRGPYVRVELSRLWGFVLDADHDVRVLP